MRRFSNAYLNSYPNIYTLQFPSVNKLTAKVSRLASLVKIGPVTAKILLIWTNVTRAYVAWTNVTLTVGIF